MSTELQTAPVDQEAPAVGEEEEELEDLPAAEKEVDPWRNAKIKRTVDGKEFLGQVEDIECGKVTKERLYRIKYSDGDLEHLTEEQVKEMLVQDPTDASYQQADGPMEDELEADMKVDKDEEQRLPVSRAPGRPSAPREKAKAKAKGKSKGKAKAKAKAEEPKAKGKAKGKAKAKEKAKPAAPKSSPKAKAKAVVMKKPAGR